MSVLGEKILLAGVPDPGERPPHRSPTSRESGPTFGGGMAAATFTGSAAFNSLFPSGSNRTPGTPPCFACRKHTACRCRSSVRRPTMKVMPPCRNSEALRPSQP